MKLKKASILSSILILFLSVFLFLAFVFNKHPIVIKIPSINKEGKDLGYEHPKIPFISSNTKPNVLAESYILIDNDTNTVLISKNPKLKIYPASTTKLATALTALNIYPLDEVITIPKEYNDGKVMGLKTDEKITIKSLVSALLVYSANDAAFNLANHHQEGVEGFVNQMNLLVHKYNLTDTNFVNFDGLHNPDHFSTAYDLSQLGRMAIKNPTISELVKTKKITVRDIDNQNIHELDSTNELLNVVPEIEGIKTGWTPEAGGCFIGLINLNGHKLISVVAQSPDRFLDTKEIISWAKQSIAWKDYSI